MRHYNKTLILFFSFVLIFSACNQKQNTIVKDNVVNTEQKAKYIFLFIGDGMSFSQINMAKAAYLNKNFRLHKKPNFGNEPMNLTKLPVTGIASTYATDRYITESAAAGSALSSGIKTSCGTVAMNPEHTENFRTITEMARDKGMKVGIVSSVSIDHATPACFYAHETDRGNYNSIASQMAISGFDYFGGGFARGQEQENQKDKTFKNILSEMKSAGYKIINTAEELHNIKPGVKCWAYNADYSDGASLKYEIDQSENYLRLSDFTEQGIRLLDNDKGFFMMVESGKIDWACHANDAVTAAHEVVALDEAVGKALDFYKKHPEETLIIITGDHETGGLTLGYAAAHYESIFEILSFQKISYENFSEKVGNWKSNETMTKEVVMDSIKYFFGLDDELKHEKLILSQYESKKLNKAFEITFGIQEKIKDEEYYVNYGGYDPLTVTVTHILNQKAGLDWASFSHTAVPVPIYAIGAGQDNFNGQLDNTDIPKRIKKIANLK